MALQQEVHLAEDDHERVVDLVGDAAGQRSDGREPLGLDHFGLCAPQVVELLPRLAVEAGVVQRESDLVGGALQQRHLFVGERIRSPPPERERSEDPVAGADRHADEALDPVLEDHSRASGRQIGRLGDLIEASDPPGQRHAPDQP